MLPHCGGVTTNHIHRNKTTKTNRVSNLDIRFTQLIHYFQIYIDVCTNNSMVRIHLFKLLFIKFNEVTTTKMSIVIIINSMRLQTMRTCNECKMAKLQIIDLMCIECWNTNSMQSLCGWTETFEMIIICWIIPQHFVRL